MSEKSPETRQSNSAREQLVPDIALNNGVRVPQLGFGVFQVPPDETQRVVEDALEAGYRHIDTAAAYRNEAGVGAAIAASGIPREDLFVTTKLRNGEQGQAVEKLYANNQSRAIGIANFLPPDVDTLLDHAEVVPALNQIELHPTYQQRDLAAKCRSLGIAIEAYSPLGQGADLDTAVVKELAASHGATPAQIVLAWHLTQGTVVIPKSANSARMRENLGATSIRLTQAEMEAITALESGARIGSDPAVAAFNQM